MTNRFKGRPCKRGHDGTRYKSTGGCVECVRVSKPAWRAANRVKNRTANTALVRRRRGVPEPTRPKPKHCECCFKPPGKRGLSIDHDHVTGKFRGWLCDACNRGIGLMGDSIVRIRKAVLYLMPTGGKPN